MEVKILAIEALESGLSADEVGELVGVGSGTIHKWRKDYVDGGVQGLCRKASSIAIRKQCSVLEEKIVALRRANPEHGVRRIRDDLRRHEGLEVSAEKVRTVVNESGLGHPPPQPSRRSPRVRRFERSCPNALWQIARMPTEELAWLTPLYRSRLREIADRITRYVEDLDSARERAAVTQEELAGRLAEQMNKTMYVLSLVAAIFLPLGLITGLLGINVGGIPGVDSGWAFTIVCLILIGIAIVQAIVFKKMKWL